MKTLTANPYTNESLNNIYELLFCDEPELFRPDKKDKLEYPRDILFAKEPDIESLLEITNDPTLETRIKLLAHRILAENGYDEGSKELLGMIIEVGMDEGLDVLAAYKDGSARYINFSENIIFWDAATEKSDALIKNLFVSGLEVVKNIGPWTDKRLAAPERGMVRLSFLVADGLYFGQGPFELLANDKMGGPVIAAATELMVFMTEQGRESGR